MKRNSLNFIVLVALLTAPFLTIISQNENKYWYFGVNAGLDFSTSPPTAISGSLNTSEGCASISTSTGDLLFYTDGTTVYNKNHIILTNGTGLLGNSSSTSSAIIVPKPCSTTEYFIFTVDYNGGSNGVNYSLINMDDDNDGVYDPLTENGHVVVGTKNINLPGPTGEKICAVKKDNDVDFWVVTTQMNTNNFFVYEVTTAGINQAPAPFNLQTVGNSFSSYGYLKANQAGDKLALANLSPSQVKLYDFDNSTGAITNPITVGSTPYFAYGVEFSTDGSQLYFSDLGNSTVAGNGFIYQVQILPTIGTPFIIATIPNQVGGYATGALQLSPENPPRIIAAKFGTNMLAAINNPNIGGVSNFDYNAIPLTNTGYLGLPTFVSGQINTVCLNLEPYANAVPDLFPQTVVDELGPLQGTSVIDKEFGDIDNDGDIDILYSKNQYELQVLINNAGPGVNPSYNTTGVSLIGDPLFKSYSFRFYDWNGDGWNDIVILGEHLTLPAKGIFLFLNNGNGTFNPIWDSILLDGVNEFPQNSVQMIAIDDLSNDGIPDILVTDYGAFLGTAFFEGTGNSATPYFNLAAPQVYSIINNTISPLFLDESLGGSRSICETYDADCDGDIDLFVSDPHIVGPPQGGGRMYFHENNGAITSNTFPDINQIGIPNQFGFDDDLDPSSPFICDFVVTRIVDFKGDDCPIAISYNYCDYQFYYYDQDCSCGSILGISEVNEGINNKDIILYPNPVGSHFSIENRSKSSIDSVVIYSITGLEIQRLEFNDTAIDVSQLSTGIYFVRVFSDEKTIAKKLIKN